MTHLTRAARNLAFAAAIGLTFGGAATAQSSLSGAYLAGVDAAKQGDVESAADYLSRALDFDPGNVELMAQTLLYVAAAGRFEPSLDLANRLNVFDANQRIAGLVLAADEMKNGEFAAVRERVKTTPEAFHPLVGAMLAAWAAKGEGDEAAGEAILETLDGRPIFRIFTLYHLGLMRHMNGDAEGAVQAYSRLANDLATPTGRVARAYAAALIANGQPDAAREIYKNAGDATAIGDRALEAEEAALEAGETPGLIVRTPAEGAAEAFYGLAAALGRDGDERLSLLYARIATWLRPDLYEAKLLTAELLAAGGQSAAAVRAFESIPPDSPLARSAEIGRAEALRSMDRNDEAVEALKALTRRAPDAIDAQVALGDLMRRTERFGEAAVAYDAAIKLMEQAGRPSWSLYYQRGISYERSNEWEKAEADFLEALKLEPDQPLVLNYLGYSWLEKGMRLEQAMEMIRKAVEQRPEDGYIVDSLGWGYYILGDFENAAAELERAVELQPVDPVLNDHYGDALWRVGRRLEAEFQWRRALSFDPDEKSRARIHRKLDVGLDVVLAEEEAKAATKKPASAANGD
ncbi:tetratricopeptide repeat protein [Pikeienuella sp. HZG-20]|uniref:tetratricopeptide repeat protein n=1 Tax=Paludibacillus litoralis TaxID=3133267 RepID=UPI0030EBA428